jgi:hypothetical protein
LLLALAACESEVAEPPATPTAVVTPLVVTRSPSVAHTGPVVSVRGETSGVDACDALFTTTTRCVASLTTDEDARERFRRALEGARERVARARASGDWARLGAENEACSVSLGAYRLSPCTR